VGTQVFVQGEGLIGGGCGSINQGKEFALRSWGLERM